MVALNGSDAFYLFKEDDGLNNIRSFRNLDGYAGDDAVIIEELGAIVFHGIQQVLLSNLGIIHDDEVGRRDELYILYEADFLVRRKLVNGILMVGLPEVDCSLQGVLRKEADAVEVIQPVF